MRNFKYMIQKQKLEAQYLKLIGVTLVMTATCVSDLADEYVLSFADEDVRENILEQFQLLSSGQLAEVIEWENAIKQVAEVHSEQGLTAKFIYSRLLRVSKSLQSMLDDSSGKLTKEYNLNIYSILCVESDIEDECWNLTKIRNKFSLVTRAGPMV